MQVIVHDAAPGTVELEVQVAEEQFGKAVSEVLDQIVKSAQIPGFRRGKAPRGIVERSLDPALVRSRAVERVLPDAYKQALEESGLQPLTEPEVEILSSETDLRFKMIVHKLPEVTPGPIQDLELTEFVTVISDVDVEQEIDDFRERNPRYVPVANGAIQVGDSVSISFPDVTTAEGETVPGSGRDHLEITVGAFLKTPAIDDALVGVKTGDTVEISTVYPEDYIEDPGLAGKEATWLVTVKEVLRPEKSDLTDNLVQENTSFESVQQYRDEVRKELQERAAALDRSSLRSQALQKLLEHSAIVFPHILIDQEVESRYRRLERTLQRNRMTVAEFAEAQGATVEQLLEQFHDEAHAFLSEYLLIHRVASLEGIEVTPAEVDEQIRQEGMARNALPAVIQIEQRTESRRNEAQYRLLQERTLDFVIANAKVTKAATGSIPAEAAGPQGPSDAENSASAPEGTPGSAAAIDPVTPAAANNDSAAETAKPAG
jgi:trigger factor